MLPHMQIQPQLIGNPHRDPVQPFQRLSQPWLKIAAHLTEMLNRQPRHTAGRVDQRPVQRAALQGFADFFGGVALQWIAQIRLVEHGKIPHQKQPRDFGHLQAVDQCIDRQHLFHRPEYHGPFHMVAVERQARRVKQANHHGTAGYALVDPFSIEQISTFSAQTRSRRECRQIVENGDDFMLATQQFSHQRTAQAGHGTIEHHFHRWGFGIFHG